MNHCLIFIDHNHGTTRLDGIEHWSSMVIITNLLTASAIIDKTFTGLDCWQHWVFYKKQESFVKLSIIHVHKLNNFRNISKTSCTASNFKDGFEE